MPKQLVVTAGPDQGLVIALPAKDSFLLGRSRANEVRLADPHVSRVHCRIEVSGDEVVLVDHDSAGGTFVNGRRVGGPQALRPGDVIRLGQTELQLRSASPDGDKTILPAAASAPTVPPAAAAPLGDMVARTVAHYALGPLLARGQSGFVFHARDTETDRPVVLKILAPRLVSDEPRRERFVRAMKTVLPLRHPNLVTVLGAGRAASQCWIAMEYVEGESLTQVVQRAGSGGRLDWRPALRVGVHLARALEYAHGRQILHRNLGPMNVLLTGRGQVAKLGDLMLAKALEGELAVDLTEPGELLGDLNYLSPERTMPSTTIDERSDLFSLGSTLYALLTGRPPFEGATMIDTIKKLRAGQVERPTTFQTSLPQPVEQVVLRLLARRPEDRYASATDLLRDLERLAAAAGVAVQ
jgi:serine/threonine protein kinase